MSRNYYCFIAGLPEIFFEQSKSIFKPLELKNALEETLHPADFEIIQNLYLEYDNQNIINLLVKNNQDNYNELAVYSKQELQDIIKEPETDFNIKQYLLDFINEYIDSEDKRSVAYWEKILLEKYYKYLRNVPNKFLKNWFEFDFIVQSITTAITARRYNLEVKDNLVIINDLTETIAKSNSKDFGIALEYPFVEEIIKIYEEEDLLRREQLLDRFRWQWLDEHTIFEYFSLEKVISILLKLRIVERWIIADNKIGKELFVKILDEIKSGYNIE